MPGYAAPGGYPPPPPSPGYGHTAYGYHGGHYKEEYHYERRGPDVGAVAASVVGGAALGFAGA